MFDRILIANRGEIACRVIRTSRKMGVQTVAVFSDADATALHVEMADIAVALGGNTPAESYLRGDAVIAAALETGAQAIHPGYGFLSENPDFVEAVEAAGLVFIGPSAKAIRAMGLKDAAKALMEQAGVPVVPGYHGTDQADARLAAEANRIGYPVLIKAVAGGGGKGMRRVDESSDFADALVRARSEAQAAFGNGDVLIEKWISTPRHIEVQVFGDGTQAVHLFERDCSLQRRHQKVIEEAPAPGMTVDMRAAMCDAAVRAAETIGYSGAGTIEFIVDTAHGLRPDGFWFMEMNTRLQVEHPVTEAVTGVDLVEWQLRVAAGEALPVTQDDISLKGHAFEARLYAEDPGQDFLPSPGRLAHLAFPTGCRVDSGVRSGDEISPFYDPMLAKIITRGKDRVTALRALDRALAATEVVGPMTNLGFLIRLARQPDFGSGNIDTGLIARHQDALVADDPPSLLQKAMASLLFLDLDRAPEPGQGFALWTALRWRVAFSGTGGRYEATVCLRGPGKFEVDVAGESIGLERRGLAGEPSFWADGCKMDASLRLVSPHVALVRTETTQVFYTEDPLVRRSGPEAGGGLGAFAPMPGLVRAVLVQQGECVEEGAPLVVVEAMKMEHVVRAGRSGRVVEIAAAPGQQVSAGDLLVRLEEI